MRCLVAHGGTDRGARAEQSENLSAEMSFSEQHSLLEASAVPTFFPGRGIRQIRRLFPQFESHLRETAMCMCAGLLFFVDYTRHSSQMCFFSKDPKVGRIIAIDGRQIRESDSMQVFPQLLRTWGAWTYFQAKKNVSEAARFE